MPTVTKNKVCHVAEPYDVALPEKQDSPAIARRSRARCKVAHHISERCAFPNPNSIRLPWLQRHVCQRLKPRRPFEEERIQWRPQSFPYFVIVQTIQQWRASRPVLVHRTLSQLTFRSSTFRVQENTIFYGRTSECTQPA